MGKVILPFLEYLVLQGIVAIIGLNVVREKKLSTSGVLKSWIFGQMLMFAVLQIIAVPMILGKLKFDVLFWSFTGVCGALLGFACWKLAKGKIHIQMQKPALSPLTSVLLIIVMLMVIGQAGVYFFGAHLDEDDARWLAEANDALEYGNMMSRDYDTGEYLGHINMPKDASSPWPMMTAFFSRILHTRTAVFAHTIFAPVELLLLYGIYWLIATELFEKQGSRIVFLFFAVLINLFLGKTVYTQSTFSLVRIWQGKATVAGVIIPLLLYLFIRINKFNKVHDWLMLPIICCAACLMSGMGISIAAIMIAVYSGYNSLIYRNWKRIPLMALAVLPSVVYLMVYMSFRSLT